MEQPAESGGVSLIRAARHVAQRLEELSEPAERIERLELRGLADGLRQAIIDGQHAEARPWAQVLEAAATLDVMVRDGTLHEESAETRIGGLAAALRDAYRDVAGAPDAALAVGRAVRAAAERVASAGREPEPEQTVMWARLDLPCDAGSVGDLSKWILDDPYKEGRTDG